MTRRTVLAVVGAVVLTTVAVGYGVHDAQGGTAARRFLGR